MFNATRKRGYPCIFHQFHITLGTHPPYPPRIQSLHKSYGYLLPKKHKLVKIDEKRDYNSRDRV